jgi:hypothetical protein
VSKKEAKNKKEDEKRHQTRVVLLLWHELLHVLDHPAHILRVLGDGAQFLLSEVRRYLLAQQDLADDVPQVGRTRSVLCGMRT